MTSILRHTLDTADNWAQAAVHNTTGTTRYQYATTSHRLTRVGGVPRRYDAAGHTTQIGSGATALTLLHGADGRLRRVERQGQAPVHYGNDGEGRRVRRRSGEEDTTTLYDAAGHWLGDYDRQGRPIQQAIWLEDLPIGLLLHDAAIARLHALYPDHLGTPRAALDLQRDAIVWRWELSGEAFGASAPNEDPDGDGQRLRLDLRFPGQRHDPATGLHENHHRDYDPNTGRYLQSDPIGIEGGINTYGYAGGNPIINFDRSGLQPDSYSHDTIDCSYYHNKCSIDGGIYYCSIAQRVCENFPDSKWARCVRRCLQDYDNEYCDSSDRNVCGGSDILCIINIHQMCWQECL